MFTAIRHSNMSMKKRLLLTAGSVAALTAGVVFVAGATFGLFSATTAAQTDNFSAGNVTLASGITGACNVAAMLPGTSPSPCTLSATYSGSVPAYLGLDILVETQHVTSGTNLYDPAGPTGGLQVTVTDNQGTPVTYTIPTTTTGCPAGAPSGSTCYQAVDELVSMTSFNGAPTNPSVTFTTSVTLPANSATGYQGGTAQIIETAHAVQSSNNSFVSGCTPGATCGTAGNWS